MHFADRLADAVRRSGPLCVGIDPRFESLPVECQLSVTSGSRSPIAAITEFCKQVLEIAASYARIMKLQSAFFELHGPEGFHAQRTLLNLARDLGYFTILDAKRGDIASTATAYAQASFGPIWNVDALTVNPYLGADAVEPFVTEARHCRGGLFVLVRTSNPGGGLFQNLEVHGEPLYRKVGRAVAEWNDRSLGNCGLGDVGAVVGATHPNELVELRAMMPKVWFLVPGYGAQGGTAEDARLALRPDGLGAIVNSSRGVMFPFKPDDTQWKSKIRDAVIRSQQELNGLSVF